MRISLPISIIPIGNDWLSSIDKPAKEVEFDVVIYMEYRKYADSALSASRLLALGAHYMFISTHRVFVRRPTELQEQGAVSPFRFEEFARDNLPAVSAHKTTSAQQEIQ